VRTEIHPLEDDASLYVNPPLVVLLVQDLFLGVNSREKLLKSATPKVARSGEFVLALLSASRKFPRTSVR
jgi:hypothetical protein